MKLEPQMRSKEKHPKMSSCKLAYRRICGVCEHFQGEHMRDVAGCGMHHWTVRGTENAADCDEWTRKNAR